MEPGAGADRSRRWLVAGRDPLPIVAGAVATVVYLVHGLHGSLSRDLSIYVYAGQQVLDGHAPYVAILNRAGPLAHLIPAAGIALGRTLGMSDPVGARAIDLVLAVLTIVAVYYWCRLVLGSRLAGVVGAATMLCFHGFIQYASDGPREKTAMLLFFVLFLIALHKRHWFRAGAWLALATLCLQIIFPPGAGAALVALAVIGRGHRLRAVVRFAAGGLSVVAVFAVYFAAMGALETAFQAFWVINRRYTEADSPFGAIPRIWHDMTDAYGASLWVMYAGCVVVLVAGYRAARGRRRPSSDPGVERLRAVAPAGGAVLFCLLWSMREFDAWPDAFPVLAPAALGLALVAVLLAERLSVRAAVTVVVVWSVLAVADSFGYAIGRHTDLLEDQQALSNAIVRPLPDDATFFTVEAPQAVAMTRSTLISPYVMYSAGLQTYLQDTYPGGLRGLGRWVARKDPTVILVTWDHTRFPHWLQPALERDYVRIGTPREIVFVAKSAGPKVIRQVRQGVERVRETHPDLVDLYASWHPK